MKPERARTTLHLSSDERMIAGVGGAVAHHAKHSGLDQETRDLLAAGLEDFCRQTLPLLSGDDDRLEVSIGEFEDRIEIVIEHHGQACLSVGMDTFLRGGAAASPTLLPGVRLLSIVDRWNTIRATEAFAPDW